LDEKILVNLIKSDENPEYGQSAVFYTVEETGKSGTNQSGLARLCGVSQPAISLLEKTLISKSPSIWLERFVGEKLTLISSDEEDIYIEGKKVGNLTIYRPDFCFAVIQHYSHLQNPVAQESSMYFGEEGFNSSVQKITGWKEPQGKKSYIPYWYQRLSLFTAKTRIPDGWWCVFEELAKLMRELEGLGYVIADVSPKTGRKITPDISISLEFCKYMRQQDFDIDAVIQKYKHYYPDGREIDANIYPDSLLQSFRSWFNSVYKPEKLPKYLGERDPESLPSIAKLLGLPESDD
jgi:hypothetical protein